MLDFLITKAHALPKTTLHHEGNLMQTSFPCIMKENISTSVL